MQAEKSHLKRRASDEPDAPLGNASPTPKKQPWQTPKTPSINEILRSRSRERLYVPPLCWTKLQPQVLECVFRRMDENEMKQSIDEPTGVAEDVKFLESTIIMPRTIRESKVKLLSHLLRAFGMSRYRDPLTFSFAGVEVADITARLVFSNTPSLPSFAFLDLAHIEKKRRRVVKCSRSKQSNNVISTIEYKRFRKLSPSNVLEDPYVVATVIALAQWQQRQDKTERTAYTAHVLALSPADELVFYTAHVTPALLDRLKMPSRRLPTSLTWISYYPISRQQSLHQMFHWVKRKDETALP